MQRVSVHNHVAVRKDKVQFASTSQGDHFPPPRKHCEVFSWLNIRCLFLTYFLLLLKSISWVFISQKLYPSRTRFEMSSAEREGSSGHGLDNQARKTSWRLSLPHPDLQPRKLQTTQENAFAKLARLSESAENKQHYTWFKLQIQYFTVHVRHYTSLK